MLDIITFDDKENLNENSTVLRKNKIIADDINQIKNAINNLIYPVGSIIFNDDPNFDPNILYGGTWTNLKGVCVVGFDQNDSDFNQLGKILGEKEHTLTEEELAKHTHVVSSGAGANVDIVTYFDSVPGSGASRYTIKFDGVTNANSPVLNNKNTGGNQPHNNIQPSYVANIWHREA